MISIVIPLYNKQYSFKRTVESVINQTFSDWELVIVNDGSTDRSGEIAQEVLETDLRIRLINQTNAGVSVARNKGIEAATSNMVAFLDADDCWLPDHLMCLVTLYHLYPNFSWFSTFSYNVKNDTDRKNIIQNNDVLDISEIKKCSRIVNFFRQSLFSSYNGGRINSSTVMINKDRIVRVGGYPEGIVIHEDLDFFFRLAMQEHLVLLPFNKVLRNLDTEERAVFRKPTYSLAPFCSNFWDSLSVTFNKDEQLYWAKQYVIFNILSYAKAQRMGGNKNESKRCLNKCRNQVKVPITKKMYRQTIVYQILPIWLIKIIHRIQKTFK